MKTKYVEQFDKIVKEMEDFCREANATMVDDKYENWNDINDWVERCLKCREELNSLQIEMIFTFRWEIEEAEE